MIKIEIDFEWNSVRRKWKYFAINNSWIFHILQTLYTCNRCYPLCIMCARSLVLFTQYSINILHDGFIRTILRMNAVKSINHFVTLNIEHQRQSQLFTMVTNTEGMWKCHGFLYENWFKVSNAALYWKRKCSAKMALLLKGQTTEHHNKNYPNYYWNSSVFQLERNDFYQEIE